MITLNLFLVVLLIAATAFFVATEFAIIRIRPSRVDQLVIEGKKNADAVQKVTDNLDGYLSACQLGITITALGLGWLGEPTVEVLLHPLFAHFHLPGRIESLLAFLVAFFFITFLHVVVGELAPKTVAIQKAEFVSFLLARPIIFFYKVMYPFIWLLNGSANRLVRLFGLKPVKEHEEAHSEEELRLILSDSYKSGKINQSEFRYVTRIFAFDDLLAREIMVPRTDMICLDLENTFEENLQIIKEEQYTRYPVIRGDRDHIAGMIHTKHFFLHCNENSNAELSGAIHPVLSVAEVMPIKNLLKKMQQERAHIAILMDEYGGTSGMITIEDILEEIVGEIRDEFDKDERIEIDKINKDHVIVDGKVSLSVICDIFGIEIENENFDTVGGWLYSHNALLKIDEEWKFNDLIFIIKEKDKHRIRKVEIKRA
jgi:CBS domain containing-hemolysin-like protein